MSYTEITFRTKSAQAWLQRRRLVFAVSLWGRPTASPGLICDFGAGGGELCKRLRQQFPDSGVICYEPARDLLDEARQNLQQTPGVTFSETITLPG